VAGSVAFGIHTFGLEGWGLPLAGLLGEPWAFPSNTLGNFPNLPLLAQPGGPNGPLGPETREGALAPWERPRFGGKKKPHKFLGAWAL